MRALLIEAGYVTDDWSQRPNLRRFADETGINYESIRKAIAGERRPGYGLMQRVADALGVAPEVFAEYELRQFDPAEVGLDAALERLEQAKGERPAK